jgi:hypothetical protein
VSAGISKTLRALFKVLLTQATACAAAYAFYTAATTKKAVCDATEKLQALVNSNFSWIIAKATICALILTRRSKCTERTAKGLKTQAAWISFVSVASSCESKGQT